MHMVWCDFVYVRFCTCLTHIVVYSIVFQVCQCTTGGHENRLGTCYITAHNSQKTIISANEYHFIAWGVMCVYMCACVTGDGNACWPTVFWRQCQHMLCKQVLNLETGIVTFSRDLIMMWCTYERGEKLCKSQLKLYITPPYASY